MNPNHIGTNFDDFLKEEGIMTDKQNFEKDINVPSKQKIMYDYNVKDCEQCSSDSICCYCKNIACYKLEEQLKRKEQECERLKLDLIEAKAHSDYLNNLALSETLNLVSEQLDQLKAENETLKQYKASKQASYESMQREWNNAVNENRELKQTLTEIKEIATNFYETGFLRTDNGCILINNNTCVETLDKILQKISEREVENE